MALMDLKSNLSWYGTPPTTDAFQNDNAKGFTADRAALAPSEFKGISGEEYTHTGIQQLGVLKFTNAFLDDHAKGFTDNAYPIGGPKKDSQFVGIQGEEFTYNGLTGVGDINKNIRSTPGEFESYTPTVGNLGTRFVYNEDLTVSVGAAKGFSRDGQNVDSLTIPTAADKFAIDDVSFSSRGNASRKAQLGSGFPFTNIAGLGPFGFKPETRTGWNPDNKYGDVIGGSAQKANDDNDYPGLGATYAKDSPIDEIYNKLNLREDATQIGFIDHPLILRGIQRKDNSDPQRWGLGATTAGKISSTLDLPRGGVLTSVERALVDVARLAKFSVSPPGLGYIVRQVGYQLMNPNVEGTDGKRQKLFHKNSTRLFTPVNTLLAGAAQLAGLHIKRHGLLPVDLPGGVPGTYEGVIKARDNEGIDSSINKNRLVQISQKYGAGYQTSMIAQTTPIAIGQAELGDGVVGGILSGPGGPQSFGGIGNTKISRWADTTIKTQLGDGAEPKAGAGGLEFGSYTAAYYTYGRPYQGIKDSPESKILRGNSIDATGTDGGESTYGLNNTNLAYRVGTPDFSDSDQGTFHSFNIPGDNVIGQGNATHPTTMRKKATDPQESVMGGEAAPGISKLAAYTSIRKITKDRTPESSAIIDFRSLKLNDENAPLSGYGEKDELNPNGDKTLTTRGYPSFLPTDSPRTDSPDIYWSDPNEPGLIKFYFLPIDPAGGNPSSGNIGFRAYIESLDDSFNPSWTGNNDQGRADQIWQYTGFDRQISVSFKVPVTSAAEKQEVWKRLANLARITQPLYGGTAGFYGQFVRVTIGDMFVSIPMYINDLTYSWDNETPWEITDGEQVPFYTTVDMTLGYVGNTAPSTTTPIYNYG